MKWVIVMLLITAVLIGRATALEASTNDVSSARDIITAQLSIIDQKINILLRLQGINSTTIDPIGNIIFYNGAPAAIVPSLFSILLLGFALQLI